MASSSVEKEEESTSPKLMKRRRESSTKKKKKKHSSEKAEAEINKTKRLKTENVVSEVETEAQMEEIKKKKVETEEEVQNISGDVTEKKQYFQRLFSKDDDIALLQGVIDFYSEYGQCPFQKIDLFCEYVKEKIDFQASKRQILTKLRNMKKKFAKKVETSHAKGEGGEDEIVFSEDFDQKVFELWRKIWGNDGVLASKSMMNIKLEEAEKPSPNVRESIGREITSLCKAEIGLDESDLVAGWDSVRDGPKKREMEEKFKKINALKTELCLNKIGCVFDASNLIFKQDNASSSVLVDGHSKGPTLEEGENKTKKRKMESLDAKKTKEDIESGERNGISMGENQQTSDADKQIADLVIGRGEGSGLAPAAADNLQTAELVTYQENQLEGSATEKKRKQKKSSKVRINQSPRNFVNEINVVPENKLGEKSVEDVGRDNIETDNLASYPANQLEANSGLTTGPASEKKKGKRKKSSKDDINQSSAAATTTSRKIVNQVPGNVDLVDATPESFTVSGRGNLSNPLAEAIQKENQIGKNIDDDVGSGKAIPSAADNIQTDNFVSYPENQLEASSGFTTGPATEKKRKKRRRKKSSKDHINQSTAATTTSREILNERETVSGSIDRVDATSEVFPNSRGDKLVAAFVNTAQNENEMGDKFADNVGSREATLIGADKLQAADNVQVADLASTLPALVRESKTLEHEVAKANAEIDADEDKSVKSTKKKKSRKAKTPTKEDTLVASGPQNVEPIKVVNVFRNVLDSLQQRNETRENLDKIAKKSSKRSKKKLSLNIAEAQVLSAEVKNAAQEAAPPINNPKDTDASFTSAKKDSESDVSHLRKSIEAADNNPSKHEKADMGDSLGSRQNDIVGGGKKQDKVTGGVKSKKERNSRAQPATSGTSHLKSRLKNDRSSSTSTSGTVNKKREENVPMLSQSKTVVGVNKGNEENEIAVDVNKETCVASGDGSQDGEVCSIAAEEEKDTFVEQLESTERKIEEVSALSLADRKHIDPKEGQDLEMEEKEADVVSCDAANTEKKNDTSVTVAVIAKEDSCVASGGIEGAGSTSNPSGSRKKLLVLDLNGLLADIVSPLAGCKPDRVIGGRAIFKRPFCEDFLKFCFEKFEVGIWSSRKQRNVESITKFLLGDMMSKLLFCWDMSYCATTTVSSLENKHKFVVFKDLNQLWEKHDPKLPWKNGDYNETNTVLLDDSPYKALLNPPYTAIFPHSYSHQNKTDTSLGSGGDLRLHLEKLVEAENVQEFIKKNPFGQEAITEASESWEFYREAIRTHKYRSRN